MHLDWIILGLLLAQLVEDLFYSLYCFVLHTLSTVGLFGDPSEGSSRLLLFTFSHSQKLWIFTICRVNQEYRCNIENSFLEVAWEQQQSDVKWGHEIKKDPDEVRTNIFLQSSFHHGALSYPLNDLKMQAHSNPPVSLKREGTFLISRW